MTRSQLLLMVQVTCDPEHLEAFNLWYNTHLPNLLRIPAYLWAQRYICLDDTSRFTALYGVRSPEDLPTILQRERPEAHPIAKSEFAAWERLQGLSARTSNVYEQISGTPLRDTFLLSDRPLSLIAADIDPAHEEEWNRWYDGSHLPNLLKVPGRVMAGRFRVFDHPALAAFNTGPKYLALYECESEEVIPTLRPGEAMHPDARAERERWDSYGRTHTSNVGQGFYKLISKHFKWPDQPEG